MMRPAWPTTPIGWPCSSVTSAPNGSVAPFGRCAWISTKCPLSLLNFTITTAPARGATSVLVLSSCTSSGRPVGSMLIVLRM